MSYEHVLYEKGDDGIAVVTLNRPERMNALHYDAHVELREVWEDFRDDPAARVAIVTGAGERAFSAGNDLKAQAERDPDAPPPPPVVFGGITRDFDCEKPIIAAVNGFALGGGFEIALSCDLIVAAEHARFGLPEPRVGLIAGAGGIHRLVRQIPHKQAMGMLLTGRHVPAAEGQALGFVNEVVPAAELLDAARRWAGQILECSPTCLAITKRGALTGLVGGPSVDEAMGRDRELFAELMASPDYIEGPRAFAEKRKPDWAAR